MVTTFTPEDLKIHGSEGLRFADAWGLTCAQLGITVSKLLEVRPSARFTQEDLVGYHFVQYGMDSGITKETIEGIQEGVWSEWDGAQALRDALQVLLADKTTSALTQRIRLGRPRDVERLQLDPSLSDYFERVTETDHTQSDVESLYPREGIGIEYRGRASLYIGSVVIGNVVEDLTTHSDVLDLMVESDPLIRTIVASSTNRGSFPAIQSLRLM